MGTCAIRLIVLLGCLAAMTAETTAQQPYLWFQQTGNHVILRWGAVQGATAYEVLVSGGANGTLTVPTNVLDVIPPPGTYTIRVRGIAAGAASPYSTPVTVLIDDDPVSAGTCTAPSPPLLTLSNTGLTLTLSWSAVSGAAGYRIQAGRSPGTAEFTQDVPATQTSFAANAPAYGTYYLRVLSIGACGTASPSGERSATLGAPTPTAATPSAAGPRTADPPPGTLLPMPSYAAAVVADMGRRYASDLAAHTGPNCKSQNSWLFKLLRELRLRDTRWGLNWKRGWAGSFSTDVITYNPTNLPDDQAKQIYLADVISAECERNSPVFNWEAVTNETWRADTLNPGLCANRFCAAWTVAPYLAAGYR
jgi:hypothetical protein